MQIISKQFLDSGKEPATPCLVPPSEAIAAAAFGERWVQSKQCEPGSEGRKMVAIVLTCMCRPLNSSCRGLSCCAYCVFLVDEKRNELVKSSRLTLEKSLASLGSRFSGVVFKNGVPHDGSCQQSQHLGG